MKLIGLITILCCFNLAGLCQKGIKLHGFYRDNLPGIIPKGTDEDGKPITLNRSAIDYLVYLTSPSGVTVNPVQMWLKGEQYKTVTQNTTSPVIIKDNLGKSKIIVPKISGRIQKLSFQERSDSKKFPNSRALASKNDLVIVYKVNGKFYTLTQKDLVRLEPKSNE